MSTVRRSLGFAFLERYLSIALQLLSFTLLARLLTPEQVGAYAVSMALISVAQVIRDFGLANYLIQCKDLDRERIGSALGVSMALALALFAIVNVGAPYVAEFYRNPGLELVVRLISVNFLIMPFNSISIALLRREMRFDQLMKVNLTAAVVAVGVTLSLAWAGLGAASLAIGDLASSLTIAVGVLLRGAWGRLARPQLLHWRAILRFGGPVTAANVITSVSMDINDLIVGRVLDLKQVAIASRAQGLMNLFNRDVMGTIRSVAYPAFSRAHREGQQMEAHYVASVGMICAIAWPFYGFISIFALETLRLFFGPQWDAAAPLVPIYCLAGALSATVNLATTAMLAAGNSRLVSMADLILQPIRACFLAWIVYEFRALQPLALGFLAAAVVGVPYFYAFKQRCLPTDFPALGRQLAKSLGVATLSLTPALAVAVWGRDASTPAVSLLTLIGCGVLTAGLWLASLKLFRHPLFGEILRLMPSRLRPSAPEAR